MRLLSLDAEVNGLYGMAFAIAFTIRENGKEVYSWQGRCPASYVNDSWVRENIFPAIEDMAVDHANPDELEEAFWKEWMEHKS